MAPFSRFVRATRLYLESRGYFERHLYSLTAHTPIAGESITTSVMQDLRYNSEPDVWMGMQDFRRFFWIGSVFRDEQSPSEWHLKEFTLVDAYARGASRAEIVELFFEIVASLEQTLGLRTISTEPRRSLSFEDAATTNHTEASGWLIVTDYPASETFFDAPEADGTSKGEIFYCSGTDTPIEIGVFGKVGPNLNPLLRIAGDHPEIAAPPEDLMGVAIGLERLFLIMTRPPDSLKPER